MLKNIQVGQTVYFEDHVKEEKILCGVVENIEQETLCSSPLRVHTEVIITYFMPERSCFPIMTRRSPNGLFATEADCLRQIQIDKGLIDIREVYREEIKSVKDLMRFIFTHEISYREKNAATDVALEKAVELFGFDSTELIDGCIEV